eukprot:COSAG06_NODE_784_length_12328_cov_4.921416_13_plen_58_part_00
MSRRERPQLVLSAQGQPRYFSSGVQDVAVRETPFFGAVFYVKPITLPRQARGKDRKR